MMQLKGGDSYMQQAMVIYKSSPSFKRGDGVKFTTEHYFPIKISSTRTLFNASYIDQM